VTSARRLYRLTLVVGASGVAVLLVAALSAADALTFAPPPLATLLGACRRLLPETGPAGLVVLSLAGLALAVLVRGTASLLRQVRASRRFRDALSPGGALEVDGATIELVDDSRALAFCAGYRRPRAFLSTGALARLTERELEAVVAHERYHAVRRDPLRILLSQTVADALFFLPAARRLSDRYRELAELGADEAALHAAGDRRFVARALLRFGETASPSTVVGIAPERVDHLLGEPPRWKLPAVVFLTSAIALVGLLAAAAAAAGMTVNAAALIAQSCMVLMIGLPAIALAASLAHRLRRRS
jgi:hypothetical protein